jgi:hypothetical protein
MTSRRGIFERVCRGTGEKVAGGPSRDTCRCRHARHQTQAVTPEKAYWGFDNPHPNPTHYAEAVCCAWATHSANCCKQGGQRA